jgi:hypothetical protein
MLTNGSTATECGGGLKVVAVVEDVLTTLGVAGGAVAVCFGLRSLSTSRYATAATASRVSAIGSVRLDRENPPFVAVR